MQICIKAKVVDQDKHSGLVSLELDGVESISLEGIPELKVVNLDTGERRRLTDQESRDLEEAIEQFHILQLARVLSKRISVM